MSQGQESTRREAIFFSPGSHQALQLAMLLGISLCFAHDTTIHHHPPTICRTVTCWNRAAAFGGVTRTSPGSATVGIKEAKAKLSPPVRPPIPTAAPTKMNPIPEHATPSSMPTAPSGMAIPSLLDPTTDYLALDIREARYDEMLSVVDLRLDVFLGGAQLHPEIRQRGLKQIMTRKCKGSTCLVATAQSLTGQGEEVVGSVEFSTHEFAETRLSPSDTPAPKLYVTEMAVSPRFRRRGIARSLLNAVDQHAQSLGYSYVCLFVETKNRAAIQLYLKAGYRLVPYSAQAMAFASAIGLYSGPFATREYYFMYKNVPVVVPVEWQQAVAMPPLQVAWSS